MPILGVRIDDDLYQQLQKYAKSAGMSISDVVRTAIRFFFEAEKAAAGRVIILDPAFLYRTYGICIFCKYFSWKLENRELTFYCMKDGRKLEAIKRVKCLRFDPRDEFAELVRRV